MILPLQLIVLLLAFISHEPEAIAQNESPYTSKGAQVTKHTDAATPLYSIQMMTSYRTAYFPRKNFLIDIDAPFTWHDCTVDWKSWDANPDCPTCTAPISCQRYECTDVRTSYSYESPSCLPVTNTSTLPGSKECLCPVNVVNPINRSSCGQALLEFDTAILNTSDGRNFFPYYHEAYPTAACAPSSMLDSFPAHVRGVMAFSTSPYAFPYIENGFGQIMALCLPSSLSTPGVMFFGNGPYYFLPNSDVDLRSLLSYTPLLKHPDSFGYFIGVKSIVVKGRSIDVTSSITKLSTIEAYTSLRTDIYKQVVHMFSVATMGILRARPVAPFGLCLKNRIGKNHAASLKVPDIVLRLRYGKTWRISSTNSMKQVKKDVACLAFVDGGATSEHGIVIGTFQMEDNFLLFDLDRSSLGFSSSLLRNKTSCANFNFTSY